MNGFASIDFFQHSLSLTIAIGENGRVDVLKRPHTICTGSKEYCMDAIRNSRVFFDGSDKKVDFQIYDTTYGSPSGVEGKQYFKSKLNQLKASSRSEIDIVIHTNSYFD